VNENEVAHSAFADTVSILKRPVSLGDQKLDVYRFTVFDKYNIQRLFLSEGEDRLAGFDSLIIATNATNNIEILATLRANSPTLETFLASGKGILVCSQKKLSQRSAEDSDATGFLPTRYEYALYDRPEPSSADGSVTATEPDDRVLSYPNEVTDALIDYHCTSNSFMVHRYRSHIVPRHPSQYQVLLSDTQSPLIEGALRASLVPGRAVMLRTASVAERLVVTSMALDWAGHEELLENILIYLTEGAGQIAVLRRRASTPDKAIDAYVLRARVAKIPVREYFDVDITDISVAHHETLIVSPAFSTDEVEKMWADLSSSSGTSIDLYHMTPDQSTGGFQLCRRSRSSSVGKMSTTASAWLARSFFPSLWGKSIWTYNYVLSMMVDLGVDVSPFLPFILKDIRKHIPPSAAPFANYDNVINASAQMLEVLGRAFVDSGFTPANQETETKPSEMFDQCARWIVGKTTGGGTNSLRDRLYMLNSLLRTSYLPRLQDESRRRVWECAIETLQSYRAHNYGACETVELTQALELALALGVGGRLSDSDLNNDVTAILSVLRSRQGVNGEWRNISETGELTLALLRLSDQHARFAADRNVAESILKGVEFLLRDFDPRLGNWRDDINATAKAAHALALFDKQAGLSAGDFFADLQARAESRAESGAHEAELEREGELLVALFRTEFELVERTVQGVAAEKRLNVQTARLKRYRAFTFGATVITLIVTSILVLFFSILFVKHRSVATKLLGDWQDYFESGLVGIILTLAFMGTYSLAKNRIIKQNT
jgi:hypothetical protein